MQLKNKRSIAELLAVATGALLTPTAERAHAIAEDLDVDMSYLEYREDDRVRVREVDIGVKWYYDDDNIFTGKIITDSITGATPSGALKPPGTASATLTSPSGVAGASGVGSSTGNYLQPLVDFVDRRVAIAAGWERTFQRGLRATFGGIFSNEDDYQSYGGNLGAAWDLNNKLTTLEGGLGYSYDFISAAGNGIQKELGNVTEDKLDAYEDGEKQTIDFGFGVTQILTRGSLIKAGISRGTVQGYLSDPYKIITLVDDLGLPDKYFHEKRPNKRTRNAVYADYNRLLEFDDVVSVGYRYFWDDWDSRSHTLDLHYRHDLRGTNYITGHFRFYRQTAADFYKPYLEETKGEDPELDTTAPTHASADYRLDDMSNYTLGVKYGTTGSLGDFFVRYEIMRQVGTHGDYRDLTAQFLQLVWTLDFVKQ